MMNLDSWNKLPPDIQKVFEDNIEYWGKETERLNEQLLAEGVAFAKESNVQIVELPASDLERLNDILAEEASKIAVSLDEKGLPGSDILAEVRRLGQS